MPSSAGPAAAVASSARRESVLVLPRAVALADGPWHGIRHGDVGRILSTITSAGEFRPRSEVERQPEWQQLIPHLVVRSGDRLLAMRRLQAGTERRLRGQVTIGVGGHVNVGDGDLSSAWVAGCQREWAEEVVCDRDLEGVAVGLLKDDAGAVGQVHLGVLILVDAKDAVIRVRERHKLEGRMTPIAELSVNYLEMETWSQFAYDAILKGELDGRLEDALPIRLPAVWGAG